jgi:hypothetical protein
MSEERDTPADLDPLARILVEQVKKQHPLGRNNHRVEDARPVSVRAAGTGVLYSDAKFLRIFNPSD